METIISVGIFCLGIFALWYTKKVRLSKSNNKKILKNEPRAIFSAALVPVGVLLNFIGLRHSSLYLLLEAIIASSCLILGVLSIFAIRKQSDKLKGSGLAGIGIAFSLLVFGAIGHATFQLYSTN